MERFQRIRGLDSKTKPPILSPTETQYHLAMISALYLYENNMAYWFTGKNPKTVMAMMRGKMAIVSLINALLAPANNGKKSRLERASDEMAEADLEYIVFSIFVSKQRVAKSNGEVTPIIERDTLRWCLHEALETIVWFTHIDDKRLALHEAQIKALVEMDVACALDNPDGQDDTDKPATNGRMYS